MPPAYISCVKTALWTVGAVMLMFFSSCREQAETYDRLDQEIARKDAYRAQKEARIARLADSVRRYRPIMTPHELYRAYDALYREYESFRFDSAFRYAALMKGIAGTLPDPSAEVESKMKYGYILSKGGLFKESLDSLVVDDIDRLPVSDSLKNQYYIVLGRIYHHLSDYTNDQTFTSLYDRKGNEALQKALVYCRDSLEIYWIWGKIELKKRNLEAARNYYRYAVEHFEANDAMTAILCSSLAYIESRTGHYDRAIDYYTISAGINIRHSRTESTSFQGLARVLFYHKGQIGKAAEFIQMALEDANTFSARQRKLAVASLLPVIVGEKMNDIEQKKAALERNFITIVVLAVLLVILFAVALVQMRRIRRSRLLLQQINARLHESNHIKEEYIGHYFHINSLVADQVDRFVGVAGRKLKNRQYADLQGMIGNLGAAVHKEAVYTDFDHTFLKLFPTFVTDFNAFLKPEDRIVPPGNALNATLRIFALIRLGITDSEQIARILDYSLHTIYNYRTRIRNKSLLPSDEFENRVRQIGA